MGGDPWTSPNRVRMTFKVSKAETEKGWRDELATINNLTSWSLARPISAPLCILLPWWPETSYKSDDGQSPARSWWPRAHIRCPAQTRRAEWPHPAWPSARPGPVCYHQPGQCNPHPSQASAVRRQCRWDDLFFKDSQTLSEAGLRPGARKYRRIFRNNRFTTQSSAQLTGE